MLRQRVADESMLRHIGKCLHVGVLDTQFSIQKVMKKSAMALLAKQGQPCSWPSVRL
jgi:hypothetical protein